MTATVSIPESTRDRLKTYGHKGMTYAQILNALMDRVEQQDFIRDLRKQYLATPRTGYTDLEDL